MNTLKEAAQAALALLGALADYRDDEAMRVMESLRATLAQEKMSENELLINAVKRSGVKVAGGRLAQKQEQKPVGTDHLTGLCDQLRVSALIDDWHTFNAVLAELRAALSNERT